jgi:hypothetical protein
MLIRCELITPYTARSETDPPAREKIVRDMGQFAGFAAWLSTRPDSFPTSIFPNTDPDIEGKLTLSTAINGTIQSKAGRCLSVSVLHPATLRPVTSNLFRGYELPLELLGGDTHEYQLAPHTFEETAVQTLINLGVPEAAIFRPQEQTA